MAMSNRDRVGKALETLQQGLKPFIERELMAVHGKYWVTTVTQQWSHDLQWQEDEPFFDIQALLKIMWEQWNDVFRRVLGHSERSLISELRDVRNRWAHQNAFSLDDTYRTLDSIQRLLQAISAPEATEIERHKQEILRLRFEEQAKQEVRKAAVAPIEGQPTGGLAAWRDVIMPHPDVARGSYQQAEFAADLAQVYRGEGSDEYRDPRAFYQRTFLTEGLRALLTTALKRLADTGGDPIVELQTNFGGGKTHSMLALYHLVGGSTASDLVGIEPVLSAAHVTHVPTVRRAVLVGTALSPAMAHTKPDGTVVATLWGEMAWQLGGAAGYRIVAESDRHGVSPGSNTLVDLFRLVGPSLILIDEWVAFIRQLYHKADLPAGSFDANLTFAQTLTEAAKAVPQILVVASLPASDIEIGGDGGREALTRLRNTFSRVESPWRPASAEEGFEIVRRRLFQPIIEPHLFATRDAVIKKFMELYQQQTAEFPAMTREAEYERRLKAAYPIHPELFDRLYNDWATLDKFQRTRGVLRFMAAVIHALWSRDDRSLLIMPATIPMDDAMVQSELTHYLDDPWLPVIEKDIDGPHSLPLRLDKENPNFGRYSAARRVARSIFLGSAPTSKMSNKGLDDRSIKLGVTQPGENAAIFGDALRRLTDQATHVYLDGQRYWYATQPSLNRLAHDRSEQLSIESIHHEIIQRLKREQRTRGEFESVYVAIPSSDIPDERDARLVILHPALVHTSRDAESLARQEATHVLDFRGNSPRIYRNTLVFLAPDSTRMKELEPAVRQVLAWQSIEADKTVLDLNPSQIIQVEAKRKAADEAVSARIGETYIWLLVPTQEPRGPIEWHDARLQAGPDLAVRASRKLMNDGSLTTQYAGTTLVLELNRIPLWRDQHVGVKQLIDYFAQYLYLPRLKQSHVLIHAIAQGVASQRWATETFAYADRWDATTGRYINLQAGTSITVQPYADAVVVEASAAAAQFATETPSPAPILPAHSSGQQTFGEQSSVYEPAQRSSTTSHPAEPNVPRVRRFFGTKRLSPAKMVSEVNAIAEAIVQHLAGIHGATVTITLDIQADLPEGATDHAVRTVSENSRVLQIDASFERE